jgi:hypothetical protein
MRTGKQSGLQRRGVGPLHVYRQGGSQSADGLAAPEPTAGVGSWA